MEIRSNYSLTRCFITKDIDIIIDNKKAFVLKLKPIKSFYTDDQWNATYHLWTSDPKELLKSAGIEKETATSFDIVNLILDLGMYSKFRSIYNMFINVLQDIIPGIEIKGVTMKVGDITITNDIWEYIIYLLKLSCGEKVTQPLTFDSDEAREFYMAQKALEDKINAIKAKDKQKNGNEDDFMKAMLSIVYSFPSLTFEFLFEQTMAQIQWLQKLAAGAVSYEVNAQAFAAGNVKKGKKLDFFIK